MHMPYIIHVIVLTASLKHSIQVERGDSEGGPHQGLVFYAPAVQAIPYEPRIAVTPRCLIQHEIPASWVLRLSYAYPCSL